MITTQKITTRFFVLGLFIFVFFGQVSGDNFLAVSKVEAANITISGTLYNADGVPYFHATGKTIKIAVGTSTPSIHSTTTDINGDWSISNISDTNLDTQTPITVWLDNDTDNATAILAGYDGYSGIISGVRLQVGDVGVIAGSGDSTYGYLFSFYDSTDDDDILYTVTNSTTTILGDFNLYSYDFIAPTTTLEIRGDFNNVSGTIYSHNDGLLYINNLKTEITNFLGGRDVNGLSAGTSSITAQSFAASGNYLYVSKSSDATACSQTAGSAVGCELMVFDISSTTNPVYVAGRDASGSSSGTAASIIYTLKVVGNYLYVGKDADATDCSQTAGSAVGCELMVFDISSTTNPVYVAGRDASGSSSGTAAVAIRNFAIDLYTGDYLYVAKNGDATACSETVGSATGCELLVFNISSTTNPTMVAARNSNGQNSGTNNSTYFSLVVYEDILFVGKAGNATACSQSAGSGANGCEIQVYDISSTTDPTYAAGRDAGGSADGIDSVSVNSLIVQLSYDGYIYVYAGKAANATDCYGVEGSATGCELLILSFDSGTGFAFWTGFDSDGSDGSYLGTSSVAINSMAISGNYLYIGKGANATACSQTAGSAHGCEFMIFDIGGGPSYTTYISGRDSSGSATGTTNSQIQNVFYNNNYLWFGKGASATACSQTAGSATGCEIQFYKATPISRFSDTYSNQFNNITTSGYTYFNNITSVSNLTISNNSTTTAFSGSFSINGNFSNNGNFIHNYGTVVLSGTNQTIDSSATTTFYNLTKTITAADTLTFSAGDTYVVTNVLTLNGSSGNRLSLRSSASGTQWNIDSAVESISYLDVKDSNNINVTAITCSTGCVNSGNNTNWSILATYLTMSGILYTDEGVTAGTSGKTIKIAVGTSTASVHSTTTASGGAWQITNISDANLSTTTPFTVWLDGDANDATTLVMGYSGSNITSVPLYYAFTIAHGTSSTATINPGSYSFYDVDDDADILYKVTATSTIVSSNLLIKQGIFSAPTTTLSISGNYKNSGTFTNNYGSIFLTGASKTLSGTLTGTSALYNLNVSGSYTISTTSASTTNVVISSTGSLTASSSLTVASNFANQGTFNSNSGTIYMENAKDEVMTYLKGVDAKGDNTGTGNVLISGFAIKGDYLYVAKGGSATACSQTAGAAGVVGCELQVYDISSTTNPVYVAGRDALGDATSATGSRMYTLAISGNYLYVGKANNANPCSQTAGASGVNGCELQVYDISSSTNPIYVAGRDSSGDSTGVGSSLIYSLAISGNYLYVVKSGSATACSQTAGSAIGCELMVFDISSTTNPTYVAGRDARGDSTGAGGTGMKSLLIRDNYLYVGKGGSITNCSQTAGATGVQGCELMVFDISSTTNPVYKAGRDSSGDTTGVASADGYLSMVILDNYLYLGKDPDNIACTQVAGSDGANGCEIQVYDISSSTNPLYKAGRDSSGSSDGVGGLMVNSLAIVNNQLYVAKDSGATACSQVAGFAEGCELMVFDISSTTNPLYIVGRDDSGSNIGTDVTPINAIINNGKYIYIGKDNDATACDQTAGSAQGCELMIFDIASGFVSGILNAASSFNNLTVLDGLVNVVNIASTTNFSVSSGATFVSPSALTVGGNYTNNGTASFNEESDYLYVSSTSAQTLSGTLTGSSILPNTVFSGSGTKTFSNNASTTNFTINSGATVVSPTVLTVAGDYTNSGTHTQTGSTAEIKSYIRKYLAGGDMSGSSNGIGNDTTYTMAKSGNYLYIGKEGDVTACSQTAGSAIGCELMVFDISTPDSPTYVAGRDVSGSATGTGNLLIKNLIVNGNYLYVGKAGDATACSQTSGSAVGCEIMVFDISSTTNPIYSVGRDSLGDSAGTSSVLIYSLAVSGNYLYVAKNFNATACSQTAGFAEGCELMVFDISSPTNPIYKAGRDSKGDSTGTGANSITYINIVGNYLYAGKGGYGAFACSQTAGSVGALGCELMVFDISSTTNPIYVAGRDSSGSSAGTGSIATYFVTSSGNTIYLSKGNDPTACSQTAGSAEGCELMVFDISSSTNPTYVAGRDSTGDSTGVGSVVAYTLAVGGNYLYAGKYNDATACSQTAGSAIGCEIMVFDISSSTNPTYVAGRDSSGLTDGTITAGSAIAAIVNAGDYLYVSKGADAVACSQTVGLANGCELMVFDIASNMSGTMTGSSAFNNLSVYGSTTISSNASTSNLFIATSSVFTAPSYLTVSGDLSTYGSFNHSSGTIILSGTNQDLVSPATTTFYNLTKSVTSADTLTFTASSTYVVAGSLTLNGAASNLLSLRSSASGTVWYLNPQATTTVSYVDVKDSNNINVTAITCSLGCVDSGNNTNWSISSLLPLLSGIIYSGVGVTEYTTGGNTIKVVVNGTSTYTDTLDGGSGAWSVNADVATGSVVTIYVDGDPTFRASLVTRALNVGNITNLNLYKDYLIVRSEDGTSVPITNDTLGTYDSSDDSDIQFTATSSTLIQPAGQSLYVYSNTNYLPNGEVTVGKSLIATSTAVTNFSTTTFNFIATSTATITATTTFSNMSFNSATGDWLITSNATTTNFTVLDGTTTAPTSLTVTGSFTNSDIYNSNSGTLYMQNARDEIVSYLGGVDANGLNNGTGSVAINALVIKGNYLYVGKNNSATACSQTPGAVGVQGCELQVYDISSSTNPTYIAGRDANGLSNGTSSIAINSLSVTGNYIYVGKDGSATACSQTAGSAIGCELMVFDISSSTNPTYVAGRDASGDSTGAVFMDIYSLSTVNNYIYIGKYPDPTACSQTAGSAIGCELMVFDISSSTNPTYVAGRDVSGDSTGTGYGEIRSVLINNNILYLGVGSDSTCSQTAGSAAGCELQVYDISSSTNPTYIAGRDASGATSGGSTSYAANSLVINDNYIYVAKRGNATACSQTAGSAIGCELMVFDISSSTNPTYVAGRDVSGDSIGTANLDINYIKISSGFIYVGKAADATACSQTAGSAIGCELIIFNIASTTNPTYVFGRDVNGLINGTSSLAINSLAILNNHIYVGKGGSATACSQTAGSAIGCELVVSNLVSGLVSGNLNSSSALANVSVQDGEVRILNNATTSALTIASGSNLDILNNLSVTGSYTNNGEATFERDKDLYFISNSSQALSGNMTDTSLLPNTIFSGSGTKTLSSNASTSKLTINSGSTVVAPVALTISNDYINNGTFSDNGGMFEIKSYISDYLAGRDASGDSTGVGNTSLAVDGIKISGNYLYVGKSSSATACSQTAGSAIGCELMVFDISSSTNPVYVAGRDVNGLSNGTSSVALNRLTVSGNYLYVFKNSSATACSQTAGSAIGCEIMVFDISSSTNPVYVAGRDSSGNSAGTGSVNIYAYVNDDNYIYIGKDASATACSQTAGSAEGCELMVFDISTPDSPTYVAGRDVSGSATGTGSLGIFSLVVNTNYLYTGKSGSATACSQTAGSAIGCELMIFDISSSTNPVYKAGRDSSGDSSGIGNTAIRMTHFNSDYVYFGKDASATACSQTAGSAEGCELMVFDISSSTNPVYVAGRDASGDSAGTGSINIWSMYSKNGYLYAGKSSSATACSQTAGSAIGCEIMVFDISSNLSGTMTGASDFNNLTIYGGATMSNNASTSNLIVSTSSTLVAPSVLTVSGDLSNYGTYTANSGTVVLSGTSQDLVSPATTTFYALTKSVTAADTLTFTAGGTYVFGNTLTLNGASGNLLSLRSSSSTGAWYIDPQATTSISYLDVQDSNNINVTTVNCDIGCLDSGRNTNWGFADPVTFVSADNYHFYVGQASTTLDQITLTKVSGASDITATNDLRIAIATTTTNFRFSTSNTSLTFGGTASGKVSSTVSYENNGATLLINVTSDFIENDTLTINGIQVGSFGSVSATSSRFALYTSGSITGSSITDDTKVINITGSLTLSDHTLDQVDNQFSFQNKADEAMFAFRLVPNNENATVTDMVLTLSGIQEVDSSEFSDFKIYRDLDSDSAISAGDQLLDSSGIMTINGQHGAITFSSDFLATSSADYIMTADTTLVDRDDTLVISLPATGITATGVTSAYTTSVIGAPSDIQHERHGAGGGSNSGRIGDDAPAGNGVVTGGDESGGGGAGQGSDGENIASDPDFLRPSANGDIDNEWTNPANAYNSDGVYATAASAALKQSYSGFGFNVPGGNTIQGIAVKLDASGTTADGTISVALSWDGGSSYTTGIATPTFTGTDVVYTVGGSGNTWGRSWTSTEFNPANFRLRVTATPVSNTVRLDALEIKIFHQAGGGGAGGGAGGGGI